MTCPLVQRMMQIVEGYPHANGLRMLLYRPADGRMICQADWMPMVEDARHGTGRGPDCLCEALGQIEAGMNVLQTTECIACATHADTE